MGHDIGTRTRLAPALVLVAAIATAAPGPARAADLAAQFVERLAPRDRPVFQAWHTSRKVHDARLQSYWTAVDARRVERRRRKAAKAPLRADDYVATFPPVYEGTQLPPALLARWTAFLAEAERGKPPAPEVEIPALSVYLAAAERIYRFVPERISERAFKERYAEEALALGLTKDQVVRIYALETGGQGTADMQAGINPITGKGRPISSAVGYAQLLDANSVNEVAKHGGYFVERLQKLAATPDLPAERVAQITAKIEALRRMVASARSVPFEWSRHQQHARTPEGQGIHALNLDGDIGPMLQAIKLHGLKVEAEKAGKPVLTGAEMELMNLAGPGTGLEILLNGAAAAAPTTNFFTRRAYGVNKMVQGLTGAGLLAEIERRMDFAMSKPGVREFEAAFEKVGQ
jgi:hypothetical protein